METFYSALPFRCIVFFLFLPWVPCNIGASVPPITDRVKTAGSSLCLSEKLIPEKALTLICWRRRKKVTSTKFSVCITWVLHSVLSICATCVWHITDVHQALLMIKPSLYGQERLIHLIWKNITLILYIISFLLTEPFGWYYANLVLAIILQAWHISSTD